jgi:GalNAc-alpha-(1->4)-GalNAc-alpha-(1->3)-diNAcBac-PP-undecaprenol alpha-1,4-N-acetyl-D-galactosaminyltransferase
MGYRKWCCEMKVLLVMPDMSYGGAPKMLTGLANALAAKSYDVTILTYYSKIIYQDVDNNIEQLCMDLPLHSSWLIRNVYQKLPVVRYLIKLTNKEKYDVQITFGDVSSLDLVMAKLFTKSKVIISERGDPSSPRTKADKIRKKLYGFADGFVFQTEGAKEFYSLNIQKKGKVIPNPVIKKDVPRVYVGKRKEEIVSVGRLDIFQKRQDILLEAFSIISSKHPNVRIKFYGDGEDKKTLEKLAEKLKISDQIIFAGVSDNIYNSIKSAQLFVLSSDFEGIPNALMEAMSIGLPVVSTNCRPGGAALLIENNKNGLLVPQRDIKALAEAIDYMLVNRTEAEIMGRNAMKIVEKYSEEKIYSEWEEYLKSV